MGGGGCHGQLEGLLGGGCASWSGSALAPHAAPTSEGVRAAETCRCLWGLRMRPEEPLPASGALPA